MPAHIYDRVGDHAASARANRLAIAADSAYFRGLHGANPYRGYFTHNLHFLAFAASMEGNFAEAKDAAARLVGNVSPGVKAMPMLEGFLPTPIVVLFAFERWDDLLKLPVPDSSFLITNAVWHSLRGVAFANTGKTAEAEKEQGAFCSLERAHEKLRHAILLRARAQAGNLAHGLKTPLAVLIDEADRLKCRGEQESAEVILQQSQRMQRQIDYQIARARAAASRSAPGLLAAVGPLLSNIISAMTAIAAHAVNSTAAFRF